VKIKNSFFFSAFILTTLLTISNSYSQEFDNGTEPDTPKKTYSEKIINPRQTHLKVSREKLKNLEKLIEQEPGNIEYLLKAADLELVLTNTKGAIKYYRKAVALMRRNPEVSIEKTIETQRKIITLFARMNKKNLAIVEFKRLCDIEPDNLNAKRNFADFLIENRYHRRAFAVYKQILKAKPDDQESVEKIMLLHAQHHITQDEIDSVLQLKQ